MSKLRSCSASATTADALQAGPDAFSAEDIHSQLKRILESTHFRSSLRLTRFLKFVVETALAGKPDSIKAYTIAVEALGRGHDFDPQRDPIVRVEAGRLRQALARYYAEAGRDDPLVIELPRGTYVPTFHCRVTASAAPHTDGKIDSKPDESPSAPSPNRDFGRMEKIDRLDTGELFAGARQFGRKVSEYRELAKVQREQLAEVSDVLDSTRRALSQSRELLAESAKLGPAPSISASAPPAPFASSNAQVAGPMTPGEARVTPFSSQPAPPEKHDRIAVHSRIRRLIAAAAGRVRTRTRLVRIGLAVIAVLSIFEVLFDIDRSLIGEPDHSLFGKIWPAPNATVPQLQSGEAAPILYVGPVAAVGKRPSGAPSPALMRDEMIDTLARFDDVRVIAEPQSAPGAAASSPASAEKNPSYYRLSTTVHYDSDSAVTLLVQLIDMADVAIAWSQTYKQPSGLDPSRTISSAAGDVARSLLDEFGLIQARERVKRAAADPMQDTYRCILDANVYLRSFEPSQSQLVQDCLIRASAKDPPAVTVFADLAFVYLRNYRLGISGPPGDPSMLDNAYRMAARAVDIKPNSAFAQYALQEVWLAKGQIARAKIAGDNSFRLNPNSGTVVFGHASLSILTGQVDEGIALLKQNAAKTPNSWIGYHLLMALGCYLKGDLICAAAESGQIASPFFPPGLVLDALVANKAGDRARAQQDITMLYQFYPAWRENLHANVARFLPDHAMADRIAADFGSAVAESNQQ